MLICLDIAFLYYNTNQNIKAPCVSNDCKKKTKQKLELFCHLYLSVHEDL